jgi:enterochelin esterase-like enzyme
MTAMHRRALLARATATLGALGAWTLGCRGRSEPVATRLAGTASLGANGGSPLPRTSREGRAGIDVLDWTFPDDHGDPRRAVVIVPKGAAAGEKLPVLVALHGMGETQSPERGAHGWLDWYAIDAAIAALRAPPLTEADFQGFVTTDRLTQVNSALQKRAYGGMIVVCPYVPSGIGYALTFDGYAAWLGSVLLPRVRKETPAATDVRRTGIDGVSLGGMSALQIGLAHPELFGVVGALQPAIRGMVGDTVDLITQKLGARPLHLVTSTEDYFRESVGDVSERLKTKGIAHDYLLTQGPHDYAWNKGPGAIEMLLWQDRKLRG